MSAILTAANPMASEKQINFIAKLISERDGRVDTAKQEVLDTVREALPTGCFNKQTASALIDMLLSPDWKLGKPAAIENVNQTVAVPEGTYTVVLDAVTNDYVTIRIATEKWADGKVVASYLAGPDNTCSYKGFGFVTAKGASVWKRFADNGRLTAALQFLATGNVDEAHEEFLARAEAYALASGQCMRCGHKLTVPASLHRGLGPECAKREGV